VLRISVDNGVVTYRKNGALVYTSKLSVPPSRCGSSPRSTPSPSTVTQVTIAAK
jgi:hypothetical protein